MKKLVIMGGLPGAGKSTVKAANANFGCKFSIDCDSLKEQCPGYDVNHPELVHEESKKLEALALETALAGEESFLYDTTATNTKRILSLISKAHKNGFLVEVVFVDVSVETSLKRNAMRERHVPEEIIYEKAALIGPAMDAFREVCDTFTHIKND